MYTIIKNKDGSYSKVETVDLEQEAKVNDERLIKIKSLTDAINRMEQERTQLILEVDMVEPILTANDKENMV